MKFAKYHGLGNDYLVIEPSAFSEGGVTPGALSPAFSLADVSRLARRICHRNYGVGSDGILLGPFASSVADFGLRIINPDGSEAEKSGNGLRIFARYLYDTRQVGLPAFQIETPGGVATAQVFPEQGQIRVGMGHASFDSVVVGISGPRREVVAELMEFAGLELSCSGVSVGNPHCVITGAPVTEVEARRLGPVVEADPRFKNRTNVQLMRPIDAHNIEIQIWERGAGYTLASGSSASAAACAARRLGLCHGQVTVHMPGGQLRVDIDEAFEVTQTGPATKVAGGEIAAEGLSDGAPWAARE